MSNNMAKIAEARKTVEQLKLEVNIDRMKVPGRGGEEGRGAGVRALMGVDSDMSRGGKTSGIRTGPGEEP